MTLFLDELADTPILVNWAIVQDPKGGAPIISGEHAFHEGRRVVAAEVVLLDPLLRWCLTLHGGYVLCGPGTMALEYSKWPRGKSEGH